MSKNYAADEYESIAARLKELEAEKGVPGDSGLTLSFIIACQGGGVGGPAFVREPIVPQYEPGDIVHFTFPRATAISLRWIPPLEIGR